MTAQPSEDVSNSDNTDSQPSYSTDSAAMQHSTFKLQGSKAVGSAQQEVTSPSVAGKTLTHHAKDNAASQTQRDNRPVAEAQVKDANQFPNAQQMQGVSSNHDAQHIGTGDDVTQAPVDAAVLTDAAMEPEEAAQQGQPAAAALPEKAFVDMELIEQVATPSLVQSAEQAQIGWGRVKGYPPWPVSIQCFRRRHTCPCICHVPTLPLQTQHAGSKCSRDCSSLKAKPT